MIGLAEFGASVLLARQIFSSVCLVAFNELDEPLRCEWHNGDIYGITMLSGDQW